jgi:hypothetical protein
MRWHLEGADVRSGNDSTLEVEAETSAEAEAIARLQGFLVSRVSAISDTNSLEYEGGATTQDVSEQLADAVVHATKPPAVNYAGPIEKVPTYPGLRIGAIVLRVAAVLWYLIGLLTLIQFIYNVLTNFSSGFGSWGLSDAMQAMTTLLPLMIGVVFHVAAEACVALRDIARNSFDLH